MLSALSVSNCNELTFKTCIKSAAVATVVKQIFRVREGHCSWAHKVIVDEAAVGVHCPQFICGQPRRCGLPCKCRPGAGP